MKSSSYMIVSKDIKEHYTNAAAKSYFQDFEGHRITFPGKFLPSKSLLAKHRAALAI